ncbi:MAG TPA: DNA-binding response regulator [Nostocaceae cyanobacterium]|nr:DNA-binding response regulator [Nostocaceae cyanobacterium]
MMYDKKILVIEDDTVTRNLFLDSLKAEGFKTIGAENGFVGIQQAQEYLPDLVICDLIMPEMDGYTVLAKLRQDPLTAIIPFIFLTASNSKSAVRKAMELGADDYLTKPSTLDELLRAIAIRLEKQALLDQWYAKNSLTVPEVHSESIFPCVPHLKEVFDYIEAHYHQGITLSDVADAVGYSAAYLTHQVAKQTGHTVNGWIVKRRMAAARPLLKNTNQTVEEISSKIGYQNACHFSRQFRQHHGLSPTLWRKQHQFLPVAQTSKLALTKNRPQLASPVPLAR